MVIHEALFVGKYNSPRLLGIVLIKNSTQNQLYRQTFTGKFLQVCILGSVPGLYFGYLFYYELVPWES